jgi:hypothetical protein
VEVVRRFWGGGEEQKGEEGEGEVVGEKEAKVGLFSRGRPKSV